MSDADWNQVRAFLAAVEGGSLTRGAKALGLNQSTLSRQIQSLEESLGVPLFERVGKRLVLTEAGRALAPYAVAMGQAAASLDRGALGRSEAVEGTVTISATDAVSMFLLPPILHRIRAEAPGVTVHILVANTLSDLRRREADIAIRHLRPTEPELIGRFIREATAGFYASRDWVARHGHPHRAEQARGAVFIGSAIDSRFADYLRELGLELGPESFRIACENSLVAWALTRQGLGISPIMREVAAGMPDLVEVLEELPPVTFPIWLLTHREVHSARRIRLVFDILAEELAVPAPTGREPEAPGSSRPRRPARRPRSPAPPRPSG